MVITGQEPQEKLALEAGEAAAFALAKRYFADFLEYVQVLEPPPGRGIIAFERWPHLMEVCGLLSDEKLIVWLKSRQTGASVAPCRIFTLDGHVQGRGARTAPISG